MTDRSRFCVFWLALSLTCCWATRTTTLERITVRLLGGTVGALTSTVSGVPHFGPGEEVILFLQPTGGAPFQVSPTSKEVNVQISPASQRVEFEMQRARTISFATREMRATDILSFARGLFGRQLGNVPLTIFRAQVESALSRVDQKRDP